MLQLLLQRRFLHRLSVVVNLLIQHCHPAELCMKHLEQLKYLQQLMKDRVLSESELVEQKEVILDALRNIQ